MPLAAKLAIGALAVAVIILGAVLLGQGGKENVRVQRTAEVEKQLPGEVNAFLERNDPEGSGSAEKATCIARSEHELRCVVTILDDGAGTDLVVDVELDPDRGTYIWSVGM